MNYKQTRLHEWSRLAYAWANHSEYDSFHRNVFKTLQTEIGSLASLAQTASPRLIDIGCGPGVFLQMIRDTLPTWRMTGLDFCPKMLEIAERRNLHGPTPINFLQLDIELPPPSTHSHEYDIATASFLFDEVEDIDSGLMNIRHFVRSGGFLVIASLAPQREFDRLKNGRDAPNKKTQPVPIVLSHGTRILVKKQLEQDKDAPHYYRWVRPESVLTDAAQSAGFSLRSDNTLTTHDLGCRNGPHLRLTVFHKDT